MKARRTLIVAGTLVWLMEASFVSGLIRPSFSAEDCTWSATDIVVAAQDEKHASRLMVLETWAGELTKGQTIEIVGLPVVPIPVPKTLLGGDSPVKSVGAERIVLYLKPARPQGADTPTTQPGTASAAQPNIKVFEGAAAYGGAQVSAVWFDKGKAYAFEQTINPGPTEFQPYGQDEMQLKKATLVQLAAKAEVAKARALADPAARALALKPLAMAQNPYQRRPAIVALGSCGKAALPLLAEMLRIENSNPGELRKALVEAAGTDSGKEMTEILSVELAYWKSVRLKMSDGWSDADPALAYRSGLLYDTLGVLAGQPYPPAHGMLVQVRDFWASVPVRRQDKFPGDPIRDACASALKRLDDGGK